MKEKNTLKNSKTLTLNMEKKRIVNILEKYIYLPLIAVLVTILFQQLFFRGNEREKLKIELRKELLRDQYQYFAKMERFIELGYGMTVINFRYEFMDLNGNIRYKDMEGINVDIPTIAYSKEFQQEWLSLTSEITESRYQIEIDIFRAFENIVTFVNEHPFPEHTDNLEQIEKSHWIKDEIIGRWLFLNKHLGIKIANKKDFKD